MCALFCRNARTISTPPKFCHYSVISVLFSSLSSQGSKFNSVLNMKSYLSPTKLFCLDNLLTSTVFRGACCTVRLNIEKTEDKRGACCTVRLNIEKTVEIRRLVSSDIITLQRPSVRSRLKVTDRSFTHHAPVLWNSLPKQLRQPSTPQSLGTTTDCNALFAHSSH